jgi:hypothetical protein
MVLDIVEQRYRNQTSVEFKCLHWWEVVRSQPKWRSRLDAPSIMDAFVSSSEATTEKDVTRPIGRDRAKTVARKGKEKEDSSSQSGFSSTMCGIMSTIKEVRHLVY